MNTKRHSEQIALIYGTAEGDSMLAEGYQCFDDISDLINYLVRLRQEGTLDEREFNKLIRTAAAAFIEAELHETLDHALGNRHLQNQLMGLLQ